VALALESQALQIQRVLPGRLIGREYENAKVQSQIFSRLIWPRSCSEHPQYLHPTHNCRMQGNQMTSQQWPCVTALAEYDGRHVALPVFAVAWYARMRSLWFTRCSMIVIPAFVLSIRIAVRVSSVPYLHPEHGLNNCLCYH
jgi:hypothetical protein